jgi:hypothetical protein
LILLQHHINRGDTYTVKLWIQSTNSPITPDNVEVATAASVSLTKSASSVDAPKRFTALELAALINSAVSTLMILSLISFVVGFGSTFVTSQLKDQLTEAKKLKKDSEEQLKQSQTLNEEVTKQWEEVKAFAKEHEIPLPSSDKGTKSQ